ncbi:MAG: enoyl-CoA hydratase/isomerase family protein [Devosia sp.]
MALVLAEVRGAVGIATLNRPAALNALNEEMLLGLTAALRGFAADDRVQAVVLRSASPRAFCAGGDIRAVRERRGDAAFMDHIYRIEYELDYLIHAFDKPVVALVNGILMGGGCGISLHARTKVATPDLVFAMPETGIGFFPDVGGSVFLSRLPDGIGPYLGMTGARLGAAEALELGLVDAVVEPAALDTLVERLAAGTPVEAALATLARAALPDSRLAEVARRARHFARGSARAIVQALEADGSDEARETAAVLRARAPFSLELTARLIAGARSWQLRDALAMDFRIAQRFMQRGDYFEGVRAVLIDRDGQPAWQPERLEEVDPVEVDACIAPLDGPELWPLSATFTDSR